MTEIRGSTYTQRTNLINIIIGLNSTFQVRILTIDLYTSLTYTQVYMVVAQESTYNIFNFVSQESRFTGSKALLNQTTTLNKYCFKITLFYFKFVQVFYFSSVIFIV
jgi:hypothetical protein